MKSFYFPLVLVIGGNLLYHVSQKSVPRTANPLIIMTFAYAVAIMICAFSAALYSSGSSFSDSIRGSNWAVFTIGVGIVSVELGFLLAYRVGWNISLAPVTSSVAVALLLIPIGITAFKERLSLWNALGIVFCLVGLTLVSHK
jgi:uncharacterized membrane protein